MAALTLNRSELTTLQTALSVAAERYRENALHGATLWAFHGSREGVFLAEQFKRQAEEADALASRAADLD